MNKRLLTSVFGVLLVASMLLTACAPAATATTEAPAAPAATEVPAAPAATEAPAAPAATEAPTAAPTEAPAAEGPKTGGRITVMDTSGFYTLDPFETPWFTLTQGAIYDTLATVDLELKEYVPLLAKSWEVAPDNLSLTIQLRDDVTFQDGTKMDAAAVKWNFDKYLRGEAKINGGWKDYISEFVVDDEYTMTIKFIKPYAPIFSDLNLTYIVSPTQYEKLGVEGFGREPIGTGPWIAKEIVENDHVLYVRNPDYKWAPAFADNQGAVYPDELYIKFLSDNAVAYAALETGEASIIGLPAQFLADAQANTDMALSKGIDWSTWYLGMNNQEAPFTDLDFRKALAYAINRDEVILAAFEGEAFPLYSSLAPSTWGYQESQNEAGKAAEPYDPEKAKELLAGLGYADSNGDGILEKDGKDLTLKLNFPPADDTQRAATTIQSQLLEVGINAELGPMEPAAISQMLNNCEQQLFLRPFGLSDAQIISSVFYSGRMGSSNRNCWTDEKTDELIDKADTTMDPEARMSAVNDLVLYLIEQRPHIPLWAPYNYVAYRANLKGLQFYKNGAYYLSSAWIE